MEKTNDAKNINGITEFSIGLNSSLKLYGEDFFDIRPLIAEKRSYKGGKYEE